MLLLLSLMSDAVSAKNVRVLRSTYVDVDALSCSRSYMQLALARWPGCKQYHKGKTKGTQISRVKACLPLSRGVGPEPQGAYCNIKGFSPD